MEQTSVFKTVIVTVRVASKQTPSKPPTGHHRLTRTIFPQQRCLTAFSDLRISNHIENLMIQLCEYFPFLVNHLDLYGKENYSYLSKITKVRFDKVITCVLMVYCAISKMHLNFYKYCTVRDIILVFI